MSSDSRDVLTPAEAWHLTDLAGASCVALAHVASDGARPHGVTLAELVALAILDQHPDGLGQSAWGRLQEVSRQRAHVVARELEERHLIGARLPSNWQVGLTSPFIRGTMAVESELVMAPAIRNRVRELRLGREWTQQQLADAVGVSRQSINSIECNRYVPSLPLALMFARVFRRSTDDIFTLESKR